jgi:hypothetical protein
MARAELDSGQRMFGDDGGDERDEAVHVERVFGKLAGGIEFGSEHGSDFGHADDCGDIDILYRSEGRGEQHRDGAVHGDDRCGPSGGDDAAGDGRGGDCVFDDAGSDGRDESLYVEFEHGDIAGGIDAGGEHGSNFGQADDGGDGGRVHGEGDGCGGSDGDAGAEFDDLYRG